jgi:hypothetical protein
VGYGEVEETPRAIHPPSATGRMTRFRPARAPTIWAGFGTEVLAALRAGVPLLSQDAARRRRGPTRRGARRLRRGSTRAAAITRLACEGRPDASGPLRVMPRSAPSLVPERDFRPGDPRSPERTWSAVERAARRRPRPGQRGTAARERGPLPRPVSSSRQW